MTISFLCIVYVLIFSKVFIGKLTMKQEIRLTILLVILCLSFSIKAQDDETQCNATNDRYVVFLDGITSHSSLEIEEKDVISNSNLIRMGLEYIGIRNFVYFSYQTPIYVDDTLITGLYCEGWGPNPCSNGLAGDLTSLFLTPIYSEIDTQQRIEYQVEVLDWLLNQIVEQSTCPTARIDLVGYSLGGIVATMWAQIHYPLNWRIIFIQ
jgi:hypothetical protein